MPIISRYVFIASMDVRAGGHALEGEPFAMSIGGAEKKIAHEGPTRCNCSAHAVVQATRFWLSLSPRWQSRACDQVARVP
jgi:hypothetical protein